MQIRETDMSVLITANYTILKELGFFFSFRFVFVCFLFYFVLFANLCIFCHVSTEPPAHAAIILFSYFISHFHFLGFTTSLIL